MEVTVLSQINRHYFTPLLPLENEGRPSVTFGLVVGGVACGCAQFVVQGQKAHLVHILVAEAYRRRGGGTYLFRESCLHLWRCGLSQIFSTPTYLPWDEQSYLGFFLTHCGCTEQPTSVSVYTAPLASFAKRLGGHGQSPHVVSVDSLSQRQWSNLLDTVRRPDHSTQLKRMVSRPNFLPQGSMISVEGGTLAGYLMLLQREPLLIEVAGLCYLGKNRRTTLHLLSTALDRATAHHPPETMVTALVNNARLAHTLDRALFSAPHTKYPVHHFTIQKGGLPWDTKN